MLFGLGLRERGEKSRGAVMVEREERIIADAVMVVVWGSGVLVGLLLVWKSVDENEKHDY